jgi:hypothetical protein
MQFKFIFTFCLVQGDGYNLHPIMDMTNIMMTWILPSFNRLTMLKKTFGEVGLWIMDGIKHYNVQQDC